MKRMLIAGAAALAFGGALAAAPEAQAAQGCGPGFFRGPAGFCRPFRPFYGPRRFRRSVVVCRIRPGLYGPRRVCVRRF